MTGGLRVVRGAPTDAELAALVGLLLVRRSTDDGPDDQRLPASRWSASARPGHAYRDGRPTRPGAGAWRASTLPR